MKKENQQNAAAATKAQWHEVGSHFGYRKNFLAQWCGELGEEKGGPTGEGYALLHGQAKTLQGDEFGGGDRLYLLRHYSAMPLIEDDDTMTDLEFFSTEEEAKAFAEGYDLARNAPNNLSIRLLEDSVSPAQRAAKDSVDGCARALYAAEHENKAQERGRLVLTAERDLEAAVQRLAFLRGIFEAGRSNLAAGVKL